MNIFIIGSCVTRDAFELFEHDHKIIEYVSRTSFASSYHNKPFPLSAQELNTQKIKSAFQRRMIEYDISRALPLLIEKNLHMTDTVIVDFIDERFHLALLNNIPATRSVAFSDCTLPQNITRMMTGSDKKFNLWSVGFDKFIHHINKRIPIIINKMFWAGQPDDEYIKNNNALLSKMYSYAEKYDITFVEPNIEPCADEAHKWGPAPYHYKKEYYAGLMNFLNQP